MKNRIALSALLITLLMGLQSCAVVGGIFKAGAATGIIVVVAIVAIVIFIIAKVSGGKK